MRSSSRVIGILSALAFLVVPAPAIAAEAKTVIELFTSQGCNSCPPADRLLGELAADDRLIALSLPVDYWDYLGWRDTLALHSHTIRQKAYAETRGDRQVYTPQVVINGVAQTIGSDRYAIEGAITKAQAKNKLTVPVSLKLNATHIEIEIGAGAALGSVASIWMIGVAQKTPVAITRGENRGKTITYHNAVRSWQRIGQWKGKSVRTTVPIVEIAGAGADAAVVFVQAGMVEGPGPIRGAAMLDLR